MSHTSYSNLKTGLLVAHDLANRVGAMETLMTIGVGIQQTMTPTSSTIWTRVMIVGGISLYASRRLIKNIVFFAAETTILAIILTATYSLGQRG